MRMRMRIRSTVVALVAVAAAPTGTAAPASAAPGDAVTTTLLKAIADLPLAAEDRTGYTRDKFPHWTDADRDGCDTGQEVLIEEATTPPTVGPGCAISGGEWYSYYDHIHHTTSRDLGIDHMVPLAEAWDSGASRWTSGERRRYANDLDDPRTLAAVTAAETEARGDKDPGEWEPSDDGADCRYLAEWTVVKSRWRLAADEAEMAGLNGLASECLDVEITYTLAR